MNGYDIKVRLDDFRPLTWRDLIIPENITFHQLHLIMQELWDFNDNHLYEFNTNDYNKRFIDFDRNGFDNDYIPEITEFDAKKNPISILFDSNKKVKYYYDFGDSWSFSIEIKNNVDYDKNYPYLKRFKGKYNPIEDCGGTMGLSFILTRGNDEYKSEDEIDSDVPIIDLDKKRDDLKEKCTFNNQPLNPEDKFSNMLNDSEFSCMYSIGEKERLRVISFDLSPGLTFRDIHEIIKHEEDLPGDYSYRFIDNDTNNVIDKKGCGKYKIK